MDCLFHFTGSLDILKCILSDRFYGSYCRETFHFGKEEMVLYIPTICFCDVPAESVKGYTAYGQYGLGLTKDWAISHKLNPVIYIEKNSTVAENWVKSLWGSHAAIGALMNDYSRYKELVAEAKKDHSTVYKLPSLTEQLQKIKKQISAYEYLVYSTYFTKHYQDDLVRSGSTISNYRFYDEREWRYIPEFDCAVCELKKSEEDYEKWRGDGAKPVLENVTLGFQPKDIGYIFVSSTYELNEMKEWIDSLKKKGVSVEEKEYLKSRLLVFSEMKIATCKNRCKPTQI